MKKVTLLCLSLMVLAASCSNTISNEDRGITKSKEVKVFLLGGQSNMVGSGVRSELEGKYTTACESVFVWNNKLKKFVKLNAGKLRGRFGPEIGFGFSLAEKYPDEPVYLVKYAVSGTGLYDKWKAEEGPLYKRLIEHAAAAKAELETQGFEIEFAGMLWMQGEQDCKDSEHLENAKNYDQNLRAMIAGFRKEFNSEIPFIIGRVHNKLITAKPHVGKNFGGVNIVRKAMADIASNDELTTMVDSDGFDLKSDNIHFNSAGQIELGKAFAKSWFDF